MLRRLSITLIMGFSILTLFAQARTPFKSVSVEEFEKAVADTSYIVLDVRTAKEYAEEHISGTDFNIDVLDDDFAQKALIALPQGKSLAIYCRSGNRSKRAAKILSTSGYKVLELASGIRGWIAAGKPTTKQ